VRDRVPLLHHQTKLGSKGLREAEQLDRYLSSGERVRIASQAFRPRETSMGTLGTGKRHGSDGESGLPRLDLDLHPLVAQELDAGPPMNPSTPVTPEDRSRTDHHWMQQHAHLTRLCRCPTIPLALLAQGTGTTTSVTSRIDHAQASIDFLAPFVDDQ